MPEYTIFQDGVRNSLSHVKSELLVSYSKFVFKKMDFLAEPTVLATIYFPKFPFVYNIAADTAYARKIAAHLCWQRQ